MRGLPSILSLFCNEFIKFNNTRAQMLDSIYHMTLSRVGSHVVSVRIHCTEKWWISFHTDVLSKSKLIFLRVFFICTQKVIHHFPAPIFTDLTMPGYPQKASYFEYRLCHKIFSGEDRA